MSQIQRKPDSAGRNGPCFSPQNKESTDNLYIKADLCGPRDMGVYEIFFLHTDTANGPAGFENLKILATQYKFPFI